MNAWSHRAAAGRTATRSGRTRRGGRAGRGLRAALLVSLLALAGCPDATRPDANGDGVVNVLDAALVASCLAAEPEGACAGADVDGNGSVELADLAAVVERFQELSAPELVESDPLPLAIGVPSSTWLRLDFADALGAVERSGFALECDGAEVAFSAHLLDEDTTLVLNPRPALPPGAECALRWLGPEGSETLAFQVAADAADAPRVVYDRDDASLLAPVPDDFYLAPDAATLTGWRLDVPAPDRPNDVRGLLQNIIDDIGPVDGWSPLAPLVVELEAAPDPASLPRTAAESLDPLASVGLFDLTPGSPTHGQRIPFELKIRADDITGKPTRHSLVIFPSIPLPPAGRVGLVIGRRMQAGAAIPFAPSPFMAGALGLPTASETAATARVRALAGEVLAGIAAQAPVPLPPEDVALALRISVRSTDSFVDDLLAMKAQAQALPPQGFVIDRIEEAPFEHAAAVIEGRWFAPDWRDGLKLARDADGAPVITGSLEVPFVLALPEAALDGPVPITMYQHGNPGSSREVRSQSARFSAADGFAVLGFTDTLNREVGMDAGAQTLAIFANLLLGAGIADFWSQTYGEQMAFLELLLSLGDLDLLPLGAPDGVPDLDVGAPLTYVGISQGGNHGQAFMAYAPEIRAGALVTGGTRLAEILFHQDGTQGVSFTSLVPQFIPNIEAPEIWAGLSLFQAAFDRQDPQNHAEFIYRNPVEVSGTTAKPSILVVEGIDDPLVTNNSTRSLAWVLGPIPHLGPVRAPVPVLDPTPGPVVGNIDYDTTAANVQYRPLDASDGLPPDEACESQTNGHYCGQAGSRPLQSSFFRSAVDDPVPVLESQRDF
ncbi:MAG: dockerin type I repeat-containing protein [Myxococcota bacterium]